MSRRGKDRTVRWLQEQTGGRYQELLRLKGKLGGDALDLARADEPDNMKGRGDAYRRHLLRMVRDYWAAKERT